jgi:tetratricopeptide (TPR) repeat protein
MKISPEDWPALSTLLDEVLALPRALHAAWLEALPRDAQRHRATLARLLDHHARVETADFLDTLPRQTLAQGGSTPDDLREIGPYRLLRELGRGGMGSVWLAERSDGLLKRAVALKLPRAGLATRAFAERLERERDILASLAHPHIARLYDAGLAADGQPYLALEYVAGRELIAHCDQRRLPLGERIALFLQVLSAVQYAHAHLVLHRDLKPGNVLVDEEGRVRLLDFGIAKLMTEGQAQETELTEQGGRAMTPDYASPEQIAGTPLGTASDVYSLGVLLFVLLTGERPYRLQRGSPAELEEAIVQANVQRPSQAVGAAGKAAARASTPARLRRALRGDLDAIVLTALAKSPEQRYATAEALRRDLERHLAGEPVQAQAERAWYRAAKFIGRHRLGFGAGLAVLLLLSGALLAALWQARQARIEARTAQSVQAFLEEIFSLNDRDNVDPARARETTARELLDRAVDRIDAQLGDVPEAKLHMLELMAQQYSDYRVGDRAVALERKVVALSRQIFGPNHPRVALALSELSEAMGNYPESSRDKLAALEEAAAILSHGDGHDAQLQGTVERRLANYWIEIDNGKAVAYAQSAVATLRRTDDAAGLGQALLTLGLAQEARGALVEAEAAMIEAGGLADRATTARRLIGVRQHAYLGRVQQRLQKFAEAEQNFRAAFAAARAQAGESGVDTIQTEFRLGNFLADSGRLQEALTVLQSAEARARGVAGVNDSAHNIALVQGWRGAVQVRLGQLEIGLQALQERTAEFERRGARSGAHAEFLVHLARTHIELGHLVEARALLDRSAAIRAENSSTPDARNLAIDAEIAWQLASGRPDRAEPLLAQFVVDGDAGGALARAQAVDKRIGGSPMRTYLAEHEVRAALIEGKALRDAARCAGADEPLSRARSLAAQIYDSATSPTLADADTVGADCALALGRREQAFELARAAHAVAARHPELGPQYREPLRRLALRLDPKHSKRALMPLS